MRWVRPLVCLPLLLVQCLDTHSGTVVDTDASESVLDAIEVEAHEVETNAHETVAPDVVVPDMRPDAEVSGAGLYIELSWRTPGDPNELDSTGPNEFFWSAGSDLSLHLATSKSRLKFFDQHDCFSWNDRPEWGEEGTADNPVLERDDSDGAGPETISLAQLSAGEIYTVGVHYADDWGYGDSFATLRVYWDGELVDVWDDVWLSMYDLWRAYTISSDGVGRIGDTPDIAHGVQDQNFPSRGRYTIESTTGKAATLGTAVDVMVVSANGAAISAASWRLEVPAGSTASLTSIDGFVQRFHPDVAGRYVAHADVAVGDYAESAVYTIVGASAVDVRVELTWTTPGDADETDIVYRKTDVGVGSDLDLHLLHGYSTGLGDPIWDCGWDNRDPGWGNYPPIDSPYLFGDDFDGGGPERIGLDSLQVGVPYTVAVHYFDDHGFGPAFATLRVYSGDVLVAEWANVELVVGAVWTAFTILDASVMRVGNTPTIEEP